MASAIYFTAATRTEFANRANSLAADAHAILRRIDSIRAEIARDVTGDRSSKLRAAWYGLADTRNAIIREWQTLTGNQWETYGENYTRP